MSPIRILIVDDHELVRRGIRALLTSRLDFEVCGEASDGIQGVDKAKELLPDIVLMDITMPNRSGLDATRLIRAALPSTEVILVSQNESSVVQRQAVEVDARAFVAKSNIANDLIPAIERVTRNRQPDGAPTQQNVFGNTEMSRRVAQYDWSSTPLGPIASWPTSLKNVVNLMLNSQHPMWIGWGPEMTFLYNDAYISVLSLAKHPWALGRRTSDVWAEIWDQVGLLVEKVFEKGQPTFVDNLRLFMSRGDRLEETYYSFSYSPIFDESGKIAGLFCPSAERTAITLNARRLRTLSELSANSLLEKSTSSACATFLATLANNPDDIPFALLYLMEPGVAPSTAVLEGIAHVARNVEGISPRRISLDGKSPGTLWPLDKVIAFSKAEIIQFPSHSALPLGAADQPITEAIVLPVASPTQLTPLGFLICGVNPTRNLDSEYLTFFSLIVDQLVSAINNARAAEDEKRRADTLAELDRAKTVFFSNISHEFRTPITLMLGPVQELLGQADSNDNESKLAPESRELLTVVHRNGLRLQKMVNALLDFSRLEAGRIQANFEPTDLSRLTRDLASGFRSTIERGGLKYEVQCDPLPEPVYVDRDMWEKVVLNLISNAFKFSFEGKIEVRLRADSEHAVLTVSDTGVGVPESELPRLFERFHRIEGSKARTHEGSGIGLALVQELVRLHHGEIAATSELGKGTTFSIAIPFGTEQPLASGTRVNSDDGQTRTATQSKIFADEMAEWLPEDPSAVAAAMGANAHGRDSEIRILIADDNTDMREYVARLLGARWTVETVSDGVAALESIQKHRPTLVVTDVMMPRMDGFELLREIRKDPATRRIPVVMLSARAGEESRIDGLEAGADDYIVKPFTARELVARVAARLDLHRLGTLLEKERSAIESLFEQTPVPIAVLTGPDVVYSIANQAYREVVGNRDVRGKPILEALPELKGQGFDTLAREVMRTGKSYVGHEALVKLDRRCTGQLEDTYFTFIYSPISGEGGENHSVAVIATEVTDQVRARKQLEILANEASSGQEKFRRLSESLDAEVRARTGELESRNAENVEQADQLRDLSVRLLKAQDDERRRLARELHDSSGQVLSVLSMNLAMLARNVGKVGQEAKNADLIRESLDMVSQISQDIRTTSYLLHPPMLDETGLAGALRWYIDGLVERGGIDIRLNIPEDFERQSREVELVIFRVVQEALTNVHRHSGSKTAVIDLSRDGDTIRLSIQDQGRGIAPEKLAAIRTKGSGVGFRGMSERVRQLKGRMQIQSDKTGTRVAVTLPAQVKTD